MACFCLGLGGGLQDCRCGRCGGKENFPWGQRVLARRGFGGVGLEAVTMWKSWRQKVFFVETVLTPLAALWNHLVSF